MLIKIIALTLFYFFVALKPALAANLAQQQQTWGDPFYVWQAIQELGDNLSGKAHSFTFRVDTSRSNSDQFDYTAENSTIYDKSNNNSFITGCVPLNSNPADRLRGLTFNTEGVPPGYEDVTIDFSCRNYNFTAGHRYLIKITNANLFGQILFGAASYLNKPDVDYFTGGGLRYGNGNIFDFSNNSGACDPVAYIWNSTNPFRNGCYVWTTPKDDLYFILSDNTPEPTPTPTPSPSPSPTPIPSKTPLILIPGIGGSELKAAEDTIWSKDDGHGGVFSHIYSKDEKVWVNEPEARAIGEDDYFDILRMNADGVNSEANLKLTDNLLARAYQNTIDFFTSNGYTLNQDFFVFPYDWRKDISLTASILDAKINQIKSQTGSTKVDIVAHSMGGLVARNYISDSQKAQNIRKLFNLGTPYLGTTDAIRKLRFGECLTPLPVSLGPFCMGIINSEMRDVLQNLISVFELVPSQTYFNFYTGEDNQHPYPYRTEVGALNYTQIKDYLGAAGHNTSLFNPSETFHSIDSTLSNTNSVDVTVIAGSGQSTLGQIIEEKTTSLLGMQSIKKDVININGDDTVPLYSASLNDPTKNQSLLGSAKLYYTNQKHGNLVTNGPALNLVKNILEGSDQIPSGVSNQPYQFNGTTLSVHSPVNIHVYDSSGNHSGSTPDGDFEINIPGSSYDTLGDAKFIYLPENGVYDIKFKATDNGSFDFKIRKFEDDENTETILYNDIPLTNSTEAETEFDTNSTQPPLLQVDNDGNGTIDTTVNSTSTLTGDAVNDVTAPKTEIQLSGTAGLNGWYKSDVTVTLNAQDEASGSGILKTEYTLDGQTINTYTEPFTVSSEKVNKLKVKSIDNAGNEENSKEVEIKIDKTAPEAKVFVDLDKLDLVVEGVDDNPTTVTSEPNNETKKKDDVIYTITDLAGSKTILDVRERDKEKKDKFRIHSIKYNEENPINLPNNYFNVNYKRKKDKLNVNEQNFELKKEVKIRIKYDAKKNKSTIVVKEPKEEKVKEVRDGLVLLKLSTNKGQLTTSY